jgi:glycosyltransferase involved in cell wall biosynthesis
MQVEPKVSVIVPNYNHARFLRKRMDTVLQQTYSDFEVIILDDCSHDSSLEVLERYRVHPRVSHFVVNRINSGSPFRQWRKGVDLARGSYVWIAESDDYADLRLLERLVPVLDEYPDVGIAYVDSFEVDEHDEEISIADSKSKSTVRCQSSYYMKGLEAITKLMFDRNAIPNASAVVFRKDIFDSIPSSYLELKVIGDWLIWIEMLKRSNLYFLAEKLNYFRYHPAVTRIHSTKEKRLRVYGERYVILNALEDIPELAQRVNAAYDILAHKTLKVFGLRRIFSRAGWGIGKRFSRYDRLLFFRISKAIWTRFRRRVARNNK